MEMFDLKDSFNKKIDELDVEIKKLKILNIEKFDEINQLNDKNHNVTNLQKKTESELKLISEKLRNIESELSQKISFWKKSKANFLRIISDNKTFLDNNFPLKEYNDINITQRSSKENSIFAALENLIIKTKLAAKNRNSNYNYNNNNNNYNYKNFNTNNSISEENDITKASSYSSKKAICNSNSEAIKSKNFNLLNADFILKCYEKYALQLKYFSALINNFNSNLITHLDSFIESLMEHVNFLHSNVELKTEHRGYLYPLDKLKTHLFCLQQILRAISFVVKILIKKIENLYLNYNKSSSGNSNTNSNSNNFNSNRNAGNINNTMIQIYTNINILIFLFNKSVTYTDLIGRYFSVMLKEERKIVNIDADNDFFSNRTKINKFLKILSTNFFQNIKIMTKYLNHIFNFDLNYHFKNFKITSDNSAMIIISVSEAYLKSLSFSNFAKAAEGILLFNKIFLNDFVKNFRSNLADLVKQLELKLELEYKMFEIIKEENKHKYNYPIINLSSLRLNNENLKKSLKEISQFFAQDLFTQIMQVFKINSWEYANSILNNLINLNKSNNLNNFVSQNLISEGDILISIFSNRIINYLTLAQMQQKSSIKAYLASEPGIDYEEAIRNKNILREMLEKENKSVRDKENYVIKLSEYEEDLKKLREQVTNYQNELDICNMKLLDARRNTAKPQDNALSGEAGNCNNSKKDLISDISNGNMSPESFSDNDNNSNDILNAFDANKNKNNNINNQNNFNLSNNNNKYNSTSQAECSLKELVKFGINISELPKEILSDDVQSGKQRSTFKLSDKDIKPIPLTKFISKSNNITEDLSVLNHRKILEKIQKYTAKIKNIDVKVIANIQSEDIKREYEDKISVFKEGFVTEINELQEKMKSVELSNLGYKENIEFLTNIMVDFEGLKECVAKCASCVRFIKMLESRK